MKRFLYKFYLFLLNIIFFFSIYFFLLDIIYNNNVIYKMKGDIVKIKLLYLFIMLCFVYFENLRLVYKFFDFF